MKTNLNEFKTSSYYLAANAKEFIHSLAIDPDFKQFLADAALKNLPKGAVLCLYLDRPYSILEDKFDDGLAVIQYLSEEPVRLSIDEVTFKEDNNELFAHLVIYFYVKDAAFTYDYIGKLFGPSEEEFDWADISFKLSFDVKLPSSTPVNNLPAYEFSNVEILDAAVKEQEYEKFFADEKAAIETGSLSDKVDVDLAKYIYSHLHGDISRYGNFIYEEPSIYTYPDIKDYYSSKITKPVYDATVSALRAALADVKFYNGNLELSDRHLLWDIDANTDINEYWDIADDYSNKFDAEFGVNSGYDGRSARHYVVDPTIENILRYDELKEGLKKYQDEFVSYINANYGSDNASAKESSKGDRQISPQKNLKLAKVPEGVGIASEGLSGDMSVEDIAKKHDVSVDKLKEQLKEGIKVEKEHTDSEKEAERIALDHLFEIPDYYDRLKKMEKGAKEGVDVTKDITDSSFTSLVSALIKDEWDAIDGYAGAIAALKTQGVDEAQIKVLEDIRDEEYVHVGQLESLLKSEVTSADNIDEGTEEGDKQLSITESVKRSNRVFKHRKK